MKRFLSIVCIVFMLVSLTACQKDEPATQNDPTQANGENQPSETPTEPELTEQPQELTLALDAIAAENYETAYQYLSQFENKTAEVEKLLSCFAFVPLELVPGSDSGQTIAYTYSPHGYLLKFDLHHEADMGSNRTSTYTHDALGNILTDSTVSTELGETFETYASHTYDENGRVLTTRVIRTQYGDTIETEIINAYDDHGNLIKKAYREDGSDWYETTYSYDYDAQGNILKCVTVTDSGTTTTTYTYDESGNLLRERTDSPKTWTEQNCTYDENGKLLTVINTHSDNLTTSSDDKIVYTYDTRGNLVSKHTEKYRNYTDSTYTYDSQDRRIEEIHTYNGGSLSRYTYTYDESGNLLTITSYSENNQVTYAKTYTYDAYGNIVTCVYDYMGGDGYDPFTSTTTYSYQLYYYPNGIPTQIQDVLADWQMQFDW